MLATFAAAELVVVGEATEETWRASEVITALQFTIYVFFTIFFDIQ